MDSEFIALLAGLEEAAWMSRPAQVVEKPVACLVKTFGAIASISFF
jgi:hypothetical protein